jgi:hypothetical protein
MTTDKEWENAMRDYLERRNPDATPEEIEILLHPLVNGSDTEKNLRKRDSILSTYLHNYYNPNSKIDRY